MSEIVKTIYDKEIKVERISSNNDTTDWQIQDEAEAVYLLEGQAILEYEDREVYLNKGDFEFIKKGAKHRVKYTSLNCEWLCLFMKC